MKRTTFAGILTVAGLGLAGFGALVPTSPEVSDDLAWTCLLVGFICLMVAAGTILEIRLKDHDNE